MSAAEQSDFTVVDRRRVKDDPEAPASEPQPSAPPPVDGEAFTTSPQHLHRLTVRDRLLMCIDILQQGAWISLGLLSDPATGQIEKDLNQARLAIDGVEALASKVEGELDEETRRDLKALVSNLQVNFVQQKSRS